jgi:uncharacterized LabA/DUF88 family protein
MAFSIVVDGHNFINDLQREGKDEAYILNTLSFPQLHAIVQERLKLEGLYSHPFIHTEFICSDRGQIGPFNDGYRKKLIKKLKNEKGITVREVPQYTQRQKGVDFTVFIRMMTLAKSPMQPHEIVLFASDTDYVPAIKLMTEQGIHVVIVGYKKGSYSLNEELINESYLSLDLGELLKEMQKSNKKTNRTNKEE